MQLKTETTAVLMCFVLTYFKSTVFAGTFEDVQRLYENLTKYMDNKIRPVWNQSDTINITVLPYLLSLQGLNEKEQVLDTTFMVQLRWFPETMIWNPSEYGNINSVRLSPKDTWVPDLVFENSQKDEFLLRKQEDMKIDLKFDGYAKWNTGSQLLTSCKVAIEHYPFDIQECYITIGKMYSADNEVNLVTKQDKLNEINPDSNDEWKIVETKVESKPAHDGYSVVEIMIRLKRRPLFYILNVISPVLMLAFMNTLCFKIPTQSGERISFCISLFLTFIVLLNVTTDSMPRVSKTICYLHVYIITQLLLSMVSTCISIVAVRASHVEKLEDLTPGLRLMLCCVCLNAREYMSEKADDVNDNTNKLDIDTDTTDVNFDEKPLSAVNMVSVIAQLDNILFLIFMMLFILSTLLGMFALLFC